MKTVYNALFVLLLLTVFSGCKEEYIGQYPVDSVAPKQVSNVQVQNMKGRVVLTYTLPEEDDLLCVTARGIGLTRMQQLRRVELPMAMPYIMSGIRIAAVSSVGTMTIAAFAGANGLGWFIMLGMNSLNYPMTVMGAVASAVMALTLDYLLGRVERALTSEGLLPQDQIKNLSLSVRSRRKAMAAALCGALLVVSVASYASIIA